MFDIKKVFKHLDGGTFGYSDLLKEFEKAYMENLYELTSDFEARDFFSILSKAGFLIVNHGAFEVSFDIERNKRRLKEIENSWTIKI